VARDGGYQRGALDGNDAWCGVALGALHNGRLEVKEPFEDGAPAQRRCLGPRGHRRWVQPW
jgi:hypothetical protein